MELDVELLLPGEDVEAMDTAVRSLGDIDKIAARVARSVRDFLRTVPVRNSASTCHFAVRAQWKDGSQSANGNAAAPRAEKAKVQRGAKSSRKHKD